MRRARAVVALCALPAWTAFSGGVGSARASIDFTYDVLPLLQRQGCSSAYCHGAATGQGGFKLSLFGSDPHADHAAITRDLGGRRLDLQQPEASLLLQKPLLLTKHGGGRRLERSSEAYAGLRAWIDAGAPFVADSARELHALAAARVGDRLVVTAHFADAHRDVSGLATFTSTDERVARVDASGTIVEVGAGEAWMLARYAGATARVRVLRPFAPTPDAIDATTPLDRAFAARLSALGLTPAPPAAPERLARRLWLDLVGRPPSPRELMRFVADGAPVPATADKLMTTAEFADVFTARLSTWMEIPTVDAERDPERARNARLRATLRELVVDDAPLAKLAEVVLAADSGFLQRHEDPRDRAEFVGRSLLGLRIGCARCHDHPNDRWRQGEHLAFSACFASPRRAPAGGMMAGVMFDGETGETVPPRLLPLPGTEPSVLADERFPALRAFALDATHDLFARNVVNRVFAWLLGRGLVEPLDDHRDSNPAVHEEWLSVLQTEFHAGGGRLRPLLRTLVTSRLYALESTDDDSADDDPATDDPATDDPATDDSATRWFARREPKPLTGDELRRALAATAGVPRALVPSLPASPLALRLALLNGEVLGKATLGARGNTVEMLATLGGSASEQLDELFLTCLSRRPRPEERAAFLPHLETSGDRGEALHELALALLLSREAEFVR